MASPAGGVSLDIELPAPVELEEPVLGVAAEPVELELGELIDPELLAAPVLVVDAPVWPVPMADVGLLCDPVAGGLCA